MAIVNIEVRNLTPGISLGAEVLNSKGKILMAKGVVLTERTISLLAMWGIDSVFMEDNQPEAVLTDQTDPDDISAECEAFFKEYDTLSKHTLRTFAFVRHQQKVPVLELKELSFSIYATILNTGAALTDYLLVNDRKIADDVARHSIMVSFVSGLITRLLHMSAEESKKVTLAGLLHDLGKLVVSKGKVDQPWDHVIKGGALLRDVKGIPSDVLLAILQHHEYVDGSGQPMGVQGSKIHLYAKIVAVADHFCLNAYREENTNPFLALHMLQKEMYGKFDPAICQVFINKIRDSLVNSRIQLNDGRNAEVVYFHADNLKCPVVKLEDGQIVDLLGVQDVSIVKLLAS
ncbi:MAG TPA: HD domain-containing phosphohydrolase [Negativicutes bacterium]|jgi:putative nucleotidyltransferase with HDIG domain